MDWDQIIPIIWIGRIYLCVVFHSGSIGGPALRYGAFHRSGKLHTDIICANSNPKSNYNLI